MAMKIYRNPVGMRTRGFSLLEVMVAVVVLSTGLLALAALQGGLSRASADAKVRTQVAALLQARLDQVRTAGYASAADSTDSCTTNIGATDGSDWVPQTFCAQNGLANLVAVQTVQTWTSAPGAGNFAVGAPASADDPQFKRITIAATWTDATGAANRRLAMATDMSELGLKDSLIPPPDDSNLGGQVPIVRQSSPATPGVIPIAIGGSDATAATNPRPEILGKNNNQSIVGTQFTVLTYTNETNAARIRRRVENSLITCTCRYGAGGSSLPEFQRQAQWPAIWTGETYEIYRPDTPTTPPGAAFSAGPAAGVTQSPLCLECCRDHHDSNASGVAKFDPERDFGNYGVSKYTLNNQNQLVVQNNTTNGTYLNACRIVRVDGIWRTAADTYSRHFGLLETQTVGGRAAATGVPSTAAADAYQVFVKDVLSAYAYLLDPPDPIPPISGADAIYNQPARGLNEPASITINRPAPKDERYLHARGLYVDAIGKKARDKIAFELNRCTTSPRVECILPYIPFTTINVTELAFWEPTVSGDPDTRSSDVIDVATGSSLVYDPLQPTRGRTNALATAANAATADSLAWMKPSNTGLAISDRGVDLEDDADQNEKRDAQAFVVSASSGSGSGGRFSVNVIGLPQTSDKNTSNDPAIAWALDASNGNCNASLGKNDTDPNSYVCNTTSALGVAGSVMVTNYFREFEQSESMTATCSSTSGNVTVTDTVARPYFANYAVSGLTLNGVAVAPPAPIADGTRDESTTASFAQIPQDAIVNFTFSLQGNIGATIQSCTATRKNSNQPWTFQNIVWNYPWAP
jgi:prepilin-type N-terminal cleavage/methylation domain-containing protein